MRPGNNRSTGRLLRFVNKQGVWQFPHAPIRKRRAFFRNLILRLQISQPAQGAEAGEEAVLTTTCDHELRQALKWLSDWPLRYIESPGTVDGPSNRIFLRRSTEERTIVHPLGLNKFELTAEVCADKRKHDSAIYSVIFQDAFKQDGP